MKKFLKKIFGYCMYCKRWLVYPKTKRRNTSYVEDEKNFMHACEGCHDRDYEDHEELTRNHYAGWL